MKHLNDHFSRMHEFKVSQTLDSAFCLSMAMHINKCQ